MDKYPPIYAVNSVRMELAARFLVIQELKGETQPSHASL